MTPEQERAEARKALEEFKSIVSRSTTVFVAEGERGKGIAVSKELLLDIAGRFVDSLDREEQLLAENRKLALYKDTAADLQREKSRVERERDQAQAKVAEQDKEIQRLRGLVKAFSDTGH